MATASPRRSAAHARQVCNELQAIRAEWEGVCARSCTTLLQLCSHSTLMAQVSAPPQTREEGANVGNARDALHLAESFAHARAWENMELSRCVVRAPRARARRASERTRAASTVRQWVCP